MKTKTIIDTIVRNSRAHSDSIRFVRTIQAGEFCRQGDVYLARVDDAHPRGQPTADRQLAHGTTKGSRHTAHGAVEVFESAIDDPLTGPVICATSRFELRHPEHSDFSLPSGTYQVTYQRDWAAEQRRPVMD